MVRRLFRLAFAFTLLILILPVGSRLTLGAAPNQIGVVDDVSGALVTANQAVDRPYICHATGAENHWVVNSPNTVGDYQGHMGTSHQDGRDIIPPIMIDGVEYSQNWAEPYITYYEAGCVFVPATETPTVIPTETSTSTPSETATTAPTETPTDVPTSTATLEPATETPTEEPLSSPTDEPTNTATVVSPTEGPATLAPTSTPTPDATLGGVEETPTESEVVAAAEQIPDSGVGSTVARETRDGLYVLLAVAMVMGAIGISMRRKSRPTDR